jgi:DNA-binding PadR family transcriptional regulator
MHSKSPADEKTRLSATSYVVLGLIGLRGPSTPYDLKQAANRSIHYFWPFPHSQLYGEPERLTKAGLLSHVQEEGGRRRRLYTLNDAGRSALIQWLKSPPGEVFEMRDLAVLQLFFGEFIETRELVALANDQVRLYEERLAVYRDIMANNPRTPGRERRMAPLDLGIRMATVCVEFWREIAANPPPNSRPHHQKRNIQRR